MLNRFRSARFTAACLTFFLCMGTFLPTGCVTEQASKPVPAKAKLFQLGRVVATTDALPPQEGRPDNLKVHVLPTGIRIRMADDVVACEYAGKLDTLLRTGPMGGESDSLLVHTGFASLSRKVVCNSKAMRIVGMIPLSGESQPYPTHSLYIGDQNDARAYVRFFVDTVRANGPWTIRSLTTEEMDKWWCYIAFDIEEPVYLVETDGGNYKFVVTYGKDGLLFSIDELNSLPDVENGRFVDTPENREKIERCRSR